MTSRSCRYCGTTEGVRGIVVRGSQSLCCDTCAERTEDSILYGLTDDERALVERAARCVQRMDAHRSDSSKPRPRRLPTEIIDAEVGDPVRQSLLANVAVELANARRSG